MRNALKELVAAISVAMCKLHEIQFSAPWNSRAGRC
jgi:hypothetical protein